MILASLIVAVCAANGQCDSEGWSSWADPQRFELVVCAKQAEDLRQRGYNATCELTLEAPGDIAPASLKL